MCAELFVTDLAEWKLEEPEVLVEDDERFVIVVGQPTGDEDFDTLWARAIANDMEAADAFLASIDEL